MTRQYLFGSDILGGQDASEDVVGMIDIQAAQRDMNGLRPVSIEIAKALLKGGQEAINGAIKGAKQPWYKSDLPGDTARQNVFWKLDWHAKQLAVTPSSSTVMYGSADDLKKWAMQAFIEANAVEEGAAYLEAAWNSMWDEIKAGLKKIPTAVVEAAASAAAAAAGAIVPTWAWVVGGVALVGVLGVVTYKVVGAVRGVREVQR